MNDLSNRVSERNKLIGASSLTIAILSAYLGSVFLHGESFFGLQFNGKYLAVLVFCSVILAIWLCLALSRVAPNYVSLATSVHVSILTTVLLLLVVDIAYAIVQNALQPISSTPGYGRDRDSNYSAGEFYPRLYYPTRRNFRIQKPNITIKGSSFGDYYSTDMLRSPTLVNSVLERKPSSISINSLGFREATPIEDASVFALGDSMTFGWNVDVEKSWVKRLESLLSTPIYNLAVHEASPKQELELLKFLLKTRVAPLKIRHLLWMISEESDLEDNYDEMAPAELLLLTRGTVLSTLSTLPHIIKQQSVIAKMMKGAIEFRYAPKELDSFHESIDGVGLVNPIFRSDRFGYKLFYRPGIDLAKSPRSYVNSHPNRPKLDQVFKEMGELAQNFGFEVTVILAPSESRLQGKYFTGFPKISDEPYFLEFVAGLARKEKFQVINLFDALQPFADQRLLYFRDDDHWNEDGNRLVATLLAQQLSGLSSQFRAR